MFTEAKTKRGEDGRQPQMHTPAAHCPFRRQKRDEPHNTDWDDHSAMNTCPAMPQRHNKQNDKHDRDDKGRIVMMMLQGGGSPVQPGIQEIERDAAFRARVVGLEE